MASLSTVSDAIGSQSMDDLPSTSRMDEEEKGMDEQSQFELLHAMERLLEGGKFVKAAAALRREINERNLVPSRTDYEGTQHTQNYRQFLSALSNLPSTSKLTSDSLPSMISRLSSLSDRAVAPPVKGLKLRLITNRRSAIQRTNEVLIPPRQPILIHGRRGHVQVLKTKHSPIEFLRAREMGSRVPPSLLPGERSIELIERHFRILGHLANVFCVAFDRTENYLITGADDNLVKVWNVNLQMLKFTYRGHSAEIADLAVSYCNQLVASGSNDKSIRVWRLQNGETLQVFKHHTASVTSVKFLPYTGNGLMRYLVTTGNDCIVNVYMFNQETLEFPAQNGLIYQRYERDQPGAKMVSICNSAGGHILVIGETHGVIRVYRMHESGEIEKMNDITAHTDRVDSLMWAHSGLRFCSGSKDGTARIWRFQYGEWQQTVLSLSQTELFLICGSNATHNNPNSKNKYKVSMVCWTLDDSRIVTTGSEHSFRVWDTTNGSQLLKLSLHTDDAFHLCAHPIHSHLILSSGHDGLIAMWDVVRGVVVHKWTNTVEQGEHAAVFDLSLTRDGTRFAIVDNKGHVSFFGLGMNKKKVPRTQFFNTDYSPIVLDPRGFAIDESTEIAPHLMPPPRMINTELEEYGPDIQVMVPGRDLGGELDESSLVCPWISRNIVPKLSENELETWAERKLILARMECEECEREKGRERPSSTPVVVPIVPFSSRRGNVRASRPISFHAAIAAENAIVQARRSENHRQRVTQAHAMAILRRDISMRYIGVEPDDGSDQELNNGRIIENEEEEEETDTSDSDYASDGERRERAREREREREPSWQQGTVSRPRRREREREVEEIEIDMDESSQHSRTERRQRRRRGEEDEFGNDLSIDMYDVLPSTSTGRRRGRREENVEMIERQERPERSNGRTKRVPRSAERQEEENEMEETQQDTVVRETTSRRQPSARDRWKFSFPDWMREVKRRRFPYVAQIGDNVVYFRQGHEYYLNTVEGTGLYFIHPKMRPKGEIGMEEFAVVEDVKYILKPYRLTQLKLAKTDSEGRRNGVTWIVKHHDMENVPDFIILRAFYEEGLAMELDVGDEIEAAIDDQWWMGTVENVNKNDESYPNALWQSVGVRWASGDDDALSLWDMWKSSTARAPGQAVSEEEETTMGSVPSCEGDWPEGDENGEAIRRRIKRIIMELQGCETIQVFSTPVPLDDYPDYSTKVAYPMDLQTICERIDNQYYRRLRSLLQDIRYIAISAETYNLKDAPIVKNAKVFVEAVIRLVNDPSIEDATRFYDSCYDLPETELVEYKRRSRPEVNSEMLDIIREVEEASGNKSKGPAGWIRDSVDILEELMQQSCARHFVTKDDNNEELAELWETCDDLRSLCEKVRGGEMNTPKEVESAVHSFVSNAKNSIESRRSEIYKDLVALQSQFNHRFKGVISKFENFQASVQLKLGVSLDRNLRTRHRDTHHHAYNTRRADHSALEAVADYEDDQPTSSSRSAARGGHERGFYRMMANGGGGGAYALLASGEMEVSSSSSRRTTGRRSTKTTAIKVEEEEEQPQSSRRLRDKSTRRVIVDTTEDEEEEDARTIGLASPSAEEMVENGEEQEEQEEDDGGDSEEEDEEEYSHPQLKKGRVSKRKAESTEEDESGRASTSTTSSTRRSKRARKARRMSSGGEEEEEEERERERESGSRGKKRGSSRPTRAARNTQQTYDERSDEEEEEQLVTNSVSQRGRQRRTRTFAT